MPPGPGTQLLLAIVNPLSGERSASVAVQRDLRARYGEDRVALLDADIFRNPEPLRRRIREAAESHAQYWLARGSAVDSGSLSTVSGGPPPHLGRGKSSTEEMQVQPNGVAGAAAIDPRTARSPVESPTPEKSALQAPGPVEQGPHTPLSHSCLAPESTEADAAAVVATGAVESDHRASPVPISSLVVSQAAAHRPRGSVLVAGGDGTVAFVMSQLEVIFAPASTAGGGPPAGHDPLVPAVAVIPMGTGNDLSNALGLGLGFTENKICAACIFLPRNVRSIIRKTLAAPQVRFDRWEAVLYAATAEHFAPDPTTHVPGAGAGGPACGGAGVATGDAVGRELIRVSFNNYASFGMDADIATRFDRRRRKWPALHRLRAMNKCWYAIHGAKAALTAPILTNALVAPQIDGRPAPLKCAGKALVVSNLPSYGGGCDVWGVKLGQRKRLKVGGGEKIRATGASFTDQKLEVVTLGGAIHSTLMQTGLMHGDRVGQGSEVDIALGAPGGKGLRLAFQADGEPLGYFETPLVLRIRALKAPAPTFVHCRSQAHE